MRAQQRAARSTGQTMEVDIACAGFGPAMGGFLTTLTRGVEARIPPIRRLKARLTPGMPLQVLCYERADDLAAGVSGVVTRGEAFAPAFPSSIRQRFPWPRR